GVLATDLRRIGEDGVVAGLAVAGHAYLNLLRAGFGVPFRLRLRRRGTQHKRRQAKVYCQFLHAHITTLPRPSRLFGTAPRLDEKKMCPMIGWGLCYNQPPQKPWDYTRS